MYSPLRFNYCFVTSLKIQLVKNSSAFVLSFFIFQLMLLFLQPDVTHTTSTINFMCFWFRYDDEAGLSKSVHARKKRDDVRNESDKKKIKAIKCQKAIESLLINHFLISPYMWKQFLCRAVSPFKSIIFHQSSPAWTLFLCLFFERNFPPCKHSGAANNFSIIFHIELSPLSSWDATRVRNFVRFSFTFVKILGLKLFV